MAERIPSGTRDVLPDEMAELRALTERVRGVFDRAGYGEVYTPALEYERAGEGAAAAYRTFDEHGNVLVLRSDMTVPIARLVGTRYPNAELPLRFCCFAHSYRGVATHRGQSRELLQAGVELIGAPAPDGTAEVLTLLCDALDAAGLVSYRVGLGDATLYPMLLLALGVPPDARQRVLSELASGDFVGVEREVGRLEGLSPEDATLLLRVPRMRGGPEVFGGLDPRVANASDGMRSVYELLPERVAARVLFDFGLLRSFGYYTGAVFQVYDPAHGESLGSGGRYDELLGQFGRPLPAVGFALNVESLHIALAGVNR
jgi:ATP phosphoribosyltransferase regulatory subunit